MSAEKENIITYHIYAKDRCLYHNLKQDEFEETWELLNVMVGLLKTDYTSDDLSYEKAAPTVGVGLSQFIGVFCPWANEDSMSKVNFFLFLYLFDG